MAVATSERKIAVLRDADAIAANAAERLLVRIAQASGRAAICLAGGSTPELLYELLARESYRNRLPWNRTHWFVGDDRFVSVDHALSNIGEARRLFLDRVEVPPENVHPMATSADTPAAAARLYETELKRFYGRDRLDPARPLFELVLMGLGTDGHTASLFPNDPVLREQEHWVAPVEKAGLEPFVPRVTLTFPALASTREMLFLVSGENKRDILARVLGGEDLPASRARSDGGLVWLVDRAAAGEDQDAS
jgi:6-phosphogluconolactonase